MKKCRECGVKIGWSQNRKGGTFRAPLCETCHREQRAAKADEKAQRRASRPDSTAGRPLTPQQRRNGGAWGRLTD